jgi:hypothetical protein
VAAAEKAAPDKMVLHGQEQVLQVVPVEHTQHGRQLHQVVIVVSMQEEAAEETMSVVPEEQVAEVKVQIMVQIQLLLLVTQIPEAVAAVLYGQEHIVMLVKLVVQELY